MNLKQFAAEGAKRSLSERAKHRHDWINPEASSNQPLNPRLGDMRAGKLNRLGSKVSGAIRNTVHGVKLIDRGELEAVAPADRKLPGEKPNDHFVRRAKERGFSR